MENNTKRFSLKLNRIKTIFSREWLLEHVTDITAYLGLILTVIIFSITTEGNLWSKYNFGILIESMSVYMLISFGAIFVYSLGNMDISVGAQLGVYSIILIVIINATGSLLLGFVAVLVVALACGAFNGAVSVWLKLPPIVTSLFIMFIFGGIQFLVIESSGSNIISAKYDFSKFLDNGVLIAVLVIVGIITFYVFNFTKLGKYTRSIGANEKVAKQCGINTTKYKVLAYMFFGILVAVGSVFMLARTGSAGRTTGGGSAMDVMLCLILGGMPLSGGMKSKLRAAIIGTLTYVILANGLIVSGVPQNYVNLIKAIVFLVIVVISCRNKSGYLPR